MSILFICLYIFITILSIYLYFEERNDRMQKWYNLRSDEDEYYSYEYFRSNRMTEVNSFLLHLFWPFFAVVVIHSFLKFVAKNIHNLYKEKI